MRRLTSVLLAAALALVPAVPALAASSHPTGDQEPLIVFNGDAVVPAGETVDSLFVVNGSATVDGVVRHVVVAFNGPVTIGGLVRGDVVAFRGKVVLAETARVTGDVYSANPVVDPRATVDGEIHGVARLSWDLRWINVVTTLGIWLAVALSVLALGMLMLWLAPRATDAAFDAARGSLGAVIGWGFAGFFGLPSLAILAIATLVGIPFGIGVLLGLALIFAIGQTTSAWLLGRSISRTSSRYVSFAIGWAILSALGLVPGLGGLLWFAGTVLGLGAILVSIWRARRGPAAERAVPPMPVQAPVRAPAQA